MFIGFSNKDNEVLMDEYEDDQSFLAFQTTISTMCIWWRRTVTGITSDGFLYIDERVSKSGYYEMPAKLLPFEKIQEVIIKKHFSVPYFTTSAILFLVLIALSLDLNYELKGISFLLGVGVVFLCCVINTVRTCIVVKSNKNYRWIATTHNRQTTKDICSYVGYLCKLKNTPYHSPIPPSEGLEGIDIE